MGGREVGGSWKRRGVLMTCEHAEDGSRRGHQKGVPSMGAWVLWHRDGQTGGGTPLLDESADTRFWSQIPAAEAARGASIKLIGFEQT